MRETIRPEGHRRLCDTEKAKLVEERSIGDYGDPAGYQERLYRTLSGFWFVWGIGGAKSPYPFEQIRIASQEDGWSRLPQDFVS